MLQAVPPPPVPRLPPLPTGSGATSHLNAVTFWKAATWDGLPIEHADLAVLNTSTGPRSVAQALVPDGGGATLCL